MALDFRETFVHASLGVHLRALQPAIAERCWGLREVRGGSRNLRGVCRALQGSVERACRTLFGGSVNFLGFGYL